MLSSNEALKELTACYLWQEYFIKYIIWVFVHRSIDCDQRSHNIHCTNNPLYTR